MSFLSFSHSVIIKLFALVSFKTSCKLVFTLTFLLLEFPVSRLRYGSIYF